MLTFCCVWLGIKEGDTDMMAGHAEEFWWNGRAAGMHELLDVHLVKITRQKKKNKEKTFFESL